MKKEVKAIVFDYNGVLMLGDGKSIHEFVSRKLKVSLDHYFDAIDTPYAKSIEGKISSKKAIETISKNLKITSTNLKKLYLMAYKKHFKQNKELFKQAFKLKKQGYKIAILSDQWALSKEALMPKNLHKNFKPFVVSCDVGIRKPNPKIYKLTIQKLKLKPSETLFIDNQKWNTDPAKKLGMGTILFKDNKQLFANSKWKKLFK